jgi:glycosyltransferase involved in cell wall biosynthesis
VRILHINDYAYPIGGAESYLRELIKAQQKRGHKVSLLTSNSLGGGTLTKYPDPTNKLVSSPVVARGTTSSSRPLRALLQIYNRNAFNVATQAVDHFKPDIVHVHMYLGQLSPAVLTPFIKEKIPVVHTSHTYRSVCPKGDRMITEGSFCRYPVGLACIRNCSAISFIHMRLRERLNPLPQNVFSKVIAPGSTMAEILKQEGFNNVVSLPYGSTFPVLKKARTVPEKPIVLYVGRLSTNKGVEDLIKAFAKIIRILPASSLVLAGDGPEREKLVRLAQNSLPANSYEFKGLIDAEQVRVLQQISRIQCIPSVWPDNSPLVVYESLSSGIPLVASAVGGIPDLVRSGNEGLLVPPGDSDAIAQSAISLLTDDSKWKDMMQASLIRARDFSMPRHAGLIDDIYQECLEQARSS